MGKGNALCATRVIFLTLFNNLRRFVPRYSLYLCTNEYNSKI